MRSNMNAKNAMFILLKIEKNSFTAEAMITCRGSEQCELSFILNNDLIITSISSKNMGKSLGQTPRSYLHYSDLYCRELK